MLARTLMAAALALAVPAAAMADHHAPAAHASPQAAADDLLAADRAFAAASAKTDLVTGLSAQFADDVVMPAPGGRFAEGKAAVVETLNSNPDNPRSRAEWTPIRVGVSADGSQGFSYGFMTIHKPDGAQARAKYLSYWVHTPKGWRVAAYKRAPRPEGEASTALMAPSLPAAGAKAVVGDHAASLAAAEKAFSDEAQTIGLGPAFAKYGRADAMNMGRGPGFVIGAQAISADVSGGAVEPSPVNWSADKVIVAASGDLGVSIGMIRINKPEEGQPAAIPFFTVWRRDAPDQPWRYVAE